MNELIIRNAGQYESTLAATVRLRAGHAPEPEWRGVEALVV